MTTKKMDSDVDPGYGGQEFGRGRLAMLHPKDAYPTLNRREFLSRAASAGVTVPSMAAILAACGGAGPTGDGGDAGPTPDGGEAEPALALLERFTWFKGAAFRWLGDGLTVYIDPWGVSEENPPADAIFITHAHFDHFSLDDIEKVAKQSTKLVAPPDVAAELTGDVTPAAPGDALEVAGVNVQVVPAYNVVEERPFHPKRNRWVGYILELQGTNYFHAGDTDHIPEHDDVRTDVVLLPIGGTPFTMDATEAGGLARSISPKVAVPMHFGFKPIGFGCSVGTPDDAEVFREQAAPVPVEVLTPVHPLKGGDGLESCG